MSRLQLPRQLHAELLSHAREGFPLEVCGILGGRGQRVERLFRMTNTDASNEHFSMEPREQFAVAKELRAAGLEMLGVYHSHPESPARPSAEDIRLAHTPGISHLIVSLLDAQQPVLKSFKIADGVVTAEELEII
jgi:proteasome lid subunit RPN8/RPN11